MSALFSLRQTVTAERTSISAFDGAAFSDGKQRKVRCIRSGRMLARLLELSGRWVPANMRLAGRRSSKSLCRCPLNDDVSLAAVYPFFPL